jgi:hypothetical protein
MIRPLAPSVGPWPILPAAVVCARYGNYGGGYHGAFGVVKTFLSVEGVFLRAGPERARTGGEPYYPDRASPVLPRAAFTMT